MKWLTQVVQLFGFGIWWLVWIAGALIMLTGFFTGRIAIWGAGMAMIVIPLLLYVGWERMRHIR